MNIVKKISIISYTIKIDFYEQPLIYKLLPHLYLSKKNLLLMQLIFTIALNIFLINLHFLNGISLWNYC
jgi:hypothetical protein